MEACASTTRYAGAPARLTGTSRGRLEEAIKCLATATLFPSIKRQCTSSDTRTSCAYTTMRVSATFAALLPLVFPALAGMPSKIYGVNLGSWLVLEAWMLPAGP